MANAKRPGAPAPKDAQGLVHNNMAPFTPEKLTEVAPGGSVSKKGGLTSGIGDVEIGTGDKKPNWP